MRPFFTGSRTACMRALAAAAFIIAGAFGSQTFAQRASAAASGPFAGLSGAWSGSGDVRMANGSRERIRCRASYNVGGDGNALRQTLNCASDSYRFSLNGNMRVQNGGDIAGDWTESSRNAAGVITGRARDGQINGMIQGSGFAAQVTVRTQGDTQHVMLVSQGEVRNVSINLRRSR